MAFRSADTPFSFVLGGALALSLGFAACGSYVPAYAANPDWMQLDIRNGDFATPDANATATLRFKRQVPDFWVTNSEDGSNNTTITVIDSDYAGHNPAMQAVELNSVTAGIAGGTPTPPSESNLIPGKLQTRLWNVRKGTDVEVTFDSTPPNNTMIPVITNTGANPKPLEDCSAKIGEKKYSVSSSDSTGAVSQLQEKKTSDTGWTTDVYTFKAAEDNPKLVFASLVTDSKCGAVIANVTAKVDRNTFPAPDLSIKRNNLPWRVYQGVKELTTAADLATQKELCKASNVTATIPPNTVDCIFTVDPARTYSYFAESRIISPYASLNCTHSTITDSRKTVSWTEEGFDPFNQEVNNLRPSVELKPDNTGNDDYVPGTRDPNVKPPAAASPSAIYRFNSVQAGFQKYEMNNKLSNTETPLIPTRQSSQDISIQVQPGDASWIEVQAARERIGGYYSTGMLNGQWSVIDTLLDFPSSKLVDRLFQRTGLMTTTEQDHCLTSRPTMPTPDNNGTSAIRPKPTLPTTQSLAPDRNLVSIEATPGDRKTQSILLEP